VIASGELASSSQFSAIKQANPTIKIPPYLDPTSGKFDDRNGPLNTLATPAPGR